MSRLFFRPNVKVETLFNKWFAWPQLIPPVTAAMHVANSHLKVMRSYVAAPQVHAQAVKNPAMTGGAFLDLGGGRVADVKALIEDTSSSSKDLIELAQAVKALEDLLQAEGTGFSLEGVYPKVPEILRGYVELVYTLSGAPIARYFEELLYHTKFYDTSRQSFALSITSGDHRPFVLSTPRLADDEHLHVHVPFASEAMDELCRARVDPRDHRELAERLGIAAEDRPRFDRLFSETPGKPPERYTGDGVRIRYFGHACVLFETRDVSVLTDPGISYTYPTSIPRFTYEDLPPRIDYVLLTHSHQDHVLFETLVQLRHRVGTVLVPRGSGGMLEDPSLRLIMRRLGFSRVVELDHLEPLEIPGGSVTGLPFLGEHGDLNVHTKLAHLLRLGSWSALLAADSNNVETRLYEHVHDVVGDVDTLFLGMECDGAPHSWLYGPLYTKSILRKNDQSRRLNGSDFERGRQIVERLGCKRVYVYAMGQEPWYGHIMALDYTPESRPIVESNKLVAFCHERGIEAERLFAQKEILVSQGAGEPASPHPETAWSHSVSP